MLASFWDRCLAEALITLTSRQFSDDFFIIGGAIGILSLLAMLRVPDVRAATTPGPGNLPIIRLSDQNTEEARRRHLRNHCGRAELCSSFSSARIAPPWTSTEEHGELPLSSAQQRQSYGDPF